MKRRYVEAIFLALILLAIVALAAYPYVRGRHDSSIVPRAENNSVVTQDVPERQYSKDIKGLPDRFNADKGKVRLLLLLSPS